MISERALPHSLEAEQVVLSCCLVSSFAIIQVASRLKVSDFYREAHQSIYTRIGKLHRQGIPVDLTTLRDSFQGGELDEVGGYGYLVDLASSIPTVSHALYYADIVADRSRRRQLITASYDAMAAAHDLDVEDPIGTAQGKLAAIENHQGGQTTWDFGQVVEDVFEPILYRAQNPSAPRLERAIQTDLYDLDHLAWIEKSDMVVLGARPSCGKTALGLQIMLAAAAAGKRVLFFSLEMSKEAIAHRYLSQMTGISSTRIREGMLTEGELDQLAAATATAMGMPFRIDDRAGLTVAQIASTTQREQMEHEEQVGLIVVDHMLKVKPSSANSGRGRHGEMTQICSDLKQLNRQIKAPLLALYQLSRGSEKEKREPTMADLRESGSVEEDVDHIWLLHRPEREGSFSETKLIVAKNRNGPVGRVDLVFQAARTSFACATGEFGASA
jgi:replicative DNA helicase